MTQTKVSIELTKDEILVLLSGLGKEIRDFKKYGSVNRTLIELEELNNTLLRGYATFKTQTKETKP